MPPSAPDDDLALGLGLGLGLGIPFLILVTYLLYVCFGPRKANGSYKWNPMATNTSLGATAGVFGTAAILPATVDMGVPQKGGEPGLYAVVSGNRWFWSVDGGAK